MKRTIKVIWKFVSYFFWPQKTDKNRYERTPYLFLK